jgi:hypothetical protein
MGAILQALQMVGIIAPFPPVKGLRTDAEVATGESSVVMVGVVVVKPF